MIKAVLSLLSAILVPLLTDWIEIDDLAVFDTSICNHEERHVFLHIISRDNFSHSTSVLHFRKKYWKWIVLRGIKIRKVSLKYFTKNRLHSILPFFSYVSKIHHLEMPCCSNLDYIVQHYGEKILSLNVSGSTNLNDEWLLNLLRQLSNLTAVDICECKELSDVSVANLVHCCLNLVSVNLCLCDGMTSESCVTVVKQFPQLHTLHTNGDISDTQLSSIADIGSNLTELDVNNCNVGDLSVMKIAEN
jgi:hypothetical protein